jgi:hypothetical protein
MLSFAKQKLMFLFREADLVGNNTYLLVLGLPDNQNDQESQKNC